MKALGLAAILALAASAALGQGILVANDLHRHGLTDQAKEAYIHLLHDEAASDVEKAQALSALGQIAFEEGRYSVAMEDWQLVIARFPDSAEASQLSSQLALLMEVVSDVTVENVHSAVAASYLSNGDFWNGSDERFTIDSSWLPKLDLAIQWYDLVLEEFPQTPAAETAYRKKLFALLGWQDPGQYGGSWGARNNAGRALPVLLATFSDFERDFPSSSYLQGFRYQIAQVYWGERNWDETRHWLNEILDNGDDQETFYTSAARARLDKIEY